MVMNDPGGRIMGTLTLATRAPLRYSRLPFIVLKVWVMCVHVFNGNTVVAVADTMVLDALRTFTDTAPRAVKPHKARHVPLPK